MPSPRRAQRLRRAVQTYYSKLLRKGPVWSMRGLTEAIRYDAGKLAGVPIEAVRGSAACGNPLGDLVKPGHTVVDIGSGGGLDSFIAAKDVGPTGRVIGVDITPAMLERARVTARRHNVTNVEFREG